MLGITDLTTYLLGTVAIILLPGPNSLFTLSVAAQRGVRAGYAAAAGIVVGDFCLMLAAVLGVAALMRAFPAAFDIVRYAGAAYLAYLGMRLLLNHSKGGSDKPVDVPARQLFRKALGISLVNVKAILFFMAFFPQFVDPAYAHPGLSFAALGLILQVVSLSYLSVLIFTGAGLARRLRAIPALGQWLQRATGVLFISFGARLALAR
ncbi:leucine efflux protein LeuE [Chitinilyticum litopenaei]|uniref:leucine efflux protein LeuE n=1 Tax=Chitinilyticum litopenaei TaxID=1121276 RepID=UPI0003FCC93C|nr:leucine efflux protein LeuE [Chitinilyticum litopenaei]